MDRINECRTAPLECQKRVFSDLIMRAENTYWGKKYNYESFYNEEDFRDSVPLQTYDSLEPYFEDIRNGHQNVLCPDKITWFAKSSGTTTGKSKFIPVSHKTLMNDHYEAGKAMLACYFDNVADSRLIFGKNISVSGSYKTHENKFNQYLVGDISAILMENLPRWAEWLKIPPKRVYRINDWEDKVNVIARYVVARNVTSLLGVPSWMLVILRHVAEVGRKPIPELWPNLEAFFHGGVAFEPYRRRYAAMIPKSDMHYMEVYNASEGYFALQDDLSSDDMLLLVNYGVYYEFVPVDMVNESTHYAVGLQDVKIGENYAMVISTESGLWRYMIGDTVTFTSTNPYKIKITGRTKAFINVVGEELISNNANFAIAEACEKTMSIVAAYTVAPYFYKESECVSHEWLVEFDKQPEDMDKFTKILDEELKKVNSDYQAKRYNDMVLKMPIVRVVPQGTFYLWFKSKNKLGGQNKVRNLSNNRTIVEEINRLINNPKQ
ncbi:MAG: GH3 auxin-responsive promoter family protein [Bacteroidales bacterium]|nr:GH3 auxin-responsive promoter family protein [Bacteroidales bacterium]